MRLDRFHIHFLAALFVSSCPIPVSPATIRVPLDAPGIQEAIDRARDGDKILVAPGQFVLSQPLDFNRLRDPAGSAPPRNLVLQSEEGPDKTRITLSSEADVALSRSVVIFRSGEDRTSSLDGFTVSGGGALDGGPPVGTRGGGIHCVNGSSPWITNCRIVGNNAESGGGLHCESGFPLITACTFSENSARRGEGGAIFCKDSSLEVVGCVISGNRAMRSCSEGSCYAGSGGGMSIVGESHVIVRDSVIDGNSADDEGGGITAGRESSLEIIGCSLSENSAGSRGGGIASDFSSIRLENCVLQGNQATYAGAILGIPVLVHCTVARNTGGALWGAPELESCIVWANDGAQIVPGSGSDTRITFSCIEANDIWEGEGNIRLDPLFCGMGPNPDIYVDASSTGPGDGSEEAPYSDLRSALRYILALSPGSPVIGTGKGGTNMGADTGTCATSSGSGARRIHVAPGLYHLDGLSLSGIESLEGAGPGQTVLEGTVAGLGTGARLAGVTVAGGLLRGGIFVGEGEAPEIVNVDIEGNAASDAFSLGGGIHCGRSSRPTFTNCRIRRNRALSGGGVYCGNESAPVFIDCTISHNVALERGAGVLSDKSLATFKNCDITGNFVDGQNGEGGGVAAFAPHPVLTDCTISENIARHGSGVHGSPSLDHCTVTANAGDEAIFGNPTLTSSIVWNNDGLTFSDPQAASLAVTYSCIQGATVWPGEGNINADPLFCGWPRHEVHVEASAPDVGDGSLEKPYRDLARALEYSQGLSKDSPCRGTGKEGTDMGAARVECETPGSGPILVRLGKGTYGHAVVSLANGTSLVGAGIDETLIDGGVQGLRTGAVLSDLTVQGSENLGGVHVGDGQSPVVSRVRITRNLGLATTQLGGGVNCGQRSSPIFNECIIQGNKGWHGGGVSCAAGSAAIFNFCVISGNASLHAGGGIYCDRSSSLILNNCLVMGNSTLQEAEGFGGAVYSDGNALTLKNCTVAGNSVARTFGNAAIVYASWTRAVLVNSIVWGNFVPSFMANPGNLHSTSSDIEAAEVSSGNLNEDPLFSDPGLFDFNRFRETLVGGRVERLPDFEVRAPDYRLFRESPAIDSGSDGGGPSLDLDGASRPCWRGFDMGAYERCGDEPPIPFEGFVRGDANGDLAINIVDPIFFLSYLFVGSVEPRCLDAADVDDSGDLEITDAIFSLTFQFLGGLTIPTPNACGRDPTFDALNCIRYDVCSRS